LSHLDPAFGDPEIIQFSTEQRLFSREKARSTMDLFRKEEQKLREKREQGMVMSCNFMCR
jgi:hypothetical protein